VFPHILRSRWRPGAVTRKKEEELQEGTEAVKGAKQSGQASMRRSRCLYGFAGGVSTLVGILGFMPAYIVRFIGGRWHFDAVTPSDFQDVRTAVLHFGPKWDLLICAHAFFCALWTILSANQVITGALGRPGVMKTWHRWGGRAAVLAVVLAVFQATVLQLHKPLTVRHIAVFVNIALILGNVGLGIYAARAKRFTFHQAAMAWGCAWAASPGGIRLSNYILLGAIGCSMNGSGDGAGLLWGNTLLQMPSLVVAMLSTRKMDAGLGRLAFWNLAAVAFVDYGDTIMVSRALRAGLWCKPQNVTAAVSRLAGLSDL